jgi:membrane-associated phospholipid phosphatase
MSNRALFWSAWCVGALVLAVMAGFAAATSYFPTDLRLAHWIQDLDKAGFGPIASFANRAGDVLPVSLITLAAVGALALMGRLWEGTFVLLTFVPRGLRWLLVEIVARPRPSANLVQVSDEASGYSFPSGHVVGAVVLYGLLFLLAGTVLSHRGLRLMLQAFCIFMIVATGPARVYVGVHWPSDVLGGYLFGLLALAPLIFAYRRRAWDFSNDG